MNRLERSSAAVALLLAVLAATAGAQNRRADQFTARISTVPISSAEVDTITGRGTATARLDGRTLRVQGAFEGMQGSATSGALHLGSVMGVRGPAFAPLDVTRAPSGEITGNVELNGDQVDALRSGRIYIQVHSEAAPEGNLWGWLLASEARR